MTEWTRSQFMAPVYALVISFGAALLLGAVLTEDSPPTSQNPETTTPPPAAPVVRLVTTRDDPSGAGSNLVPVTELRDAQVQVYSTSKGNLAVGEKGEVPLGDTAGSAVTICVKLPENWTPRSPKTVDFVQGFTCWKVAEPAGEVQLVVTKVGE
jgi:hypothetical protein